MGLEISPVVIFEKRKGEEKMRIGILQINCIVGDIVGNMEKIIDGYKKLCAQGAELVVGSELCILGYPPRDLLNNHSIVGQQLEALKLICANVGSVGLIIGVADWVKTPGKALYNKAVFIHEGHVIRTKAKELLPEYDVFDEKRYFESGPRQPVIAEYKGKRVAMIICEDAWGDTENVVGNKLYKTNPAHDLVPANPDLVVVINASPYYEKKGAIRFKIKSHIAVLIGCPVVDVHQVGGNDELICDGRSFVANEHGVCVGVAKAFAEDYCIFDTDGPEVTYPAEGIGDTYNALVLGTRDYLRKTGYTKVVIGESGGIDSAVVTCIAADAIGRENVAGITMPSPFSSAGSVNHSYELCSNLGVRIETIPIASQYNSFGETVRPVIGWKESESFGRDVTEENVQARLRGMILMAFSNRYNAMVLSTGNKSELAVGYCTLYGDMVGGLAVISDVPKTKVYDLARCINRFHQNGIVIPEIILTKEPSAELRPGQRDQDSLPPYSVLDEILHYHVDMELTAEEIIARGLFDAKDVHFIVGKVKNNEYKRRQAALGLKVMTKSFGSGRRYPIACKPQS